MPDFSIYQYTGEKFLDILTSEKLEIEKRDIREKLQVNCLTGFLTHIGAECMVLESQYVGRDYLEDYSFYFVRSHPEYEKYCRRLHFFSQNFSDEEFTEAITNQKPEHVEALKSSYLGFIVIKPLPHTIIGRTCLKSYELDGGRVYPVNRNYPVNLFGLSLVVNSLAYQEQDSEVAACASTSIWSAFHATGKLFQHEIPSPVKITQWATISGARNSRKFPNHGLTAPEIATAISHVGLDPFMYNIPGNSLLKELLHAYLDIGIPVILCFEKALLNGDSKLGIIPNSAHAVTVTGYRLQADTSQEGRNFDGLSLQSSKMSKIYVHDDQIGPFARMEFGIKPALLNEEPYEYLDTSYPAPEGHNVVALPYLAIVPLYHKIRIPFDVILKVVANFQKLHIGVFETVEGVETDFSWQVNLTMVNELKKEVHNSDELDPSKKLTLLQSHLPKYIWRATGYLEDVRQIDFLFDATDIRQGTLLASTIIYNDDVMGRIAMANTYMFNAGHYQAREVINSTTMDMLKNIGVEFP